MAGVYPPVEAASESAHHAMGVVMGELAEQNHPLVGPVVAVEIEKPIDVRDAVNQRSSGNRQEPDRYVQSFGKRDESVGAPIVVRVFQYQDSILPLPVRSGPRILLGLRHPETATGIESQVHRLADERFGGEQLDLEAGRQMEAASFFSGRTRWSRPHVGLERVFSVLDFTGRGNGFPGVQLGTLTATQSPPPPHERDTCNERSYTEKNLLISHVLSCQRSAFSYQQSAFSFRLTADC